jgi:ribosomal-protein-alanine N-acetyltransferase
MAAADVGAVVALANELKDAPHWPSAAYLAALEPDAQPQRIVLVAEGAQARIVGFIVAVLVPPEAELEPIVVSAGAQRGGIGRLLLTCLLQRLQSNQVHQLDLEVRASNQAARSFYRANGFAQVGLRPRYYANPVEDAVLMRRSVS